MLKIATPCFVEGGWIPDYNAGFGEDKSPEFHIEGIDEKVETMVITLDDLGHPLQPGYNHWIAWNIPPAECIPGGIAKGSVIEEPIHIEQGIAYGKHCYRGPKPPFNWNHEDGLYAIEFTGDYGFDAFLAQGGADSDSGVADFLVSFLSHGFYKNDSKTETGSFGCSTIYTQDADGTYYFGRNYDWTECSAMIVHTKPKNGYESVSTCCLDFLGFGNGYAPDGSMMERMQSIAAIYVPLDGMNSEGLMVADLMAGDNEETHQQTGKTALTTTTAIRLLLDKAANVDEAVALLRQYDMNSSIGSAHHLSIADAQGKSAVVEYVNGEMLKSVAQKNYPQTADSYEKTMWSIVYCPEKRCADFYFAEDYAHSYELVLSEKDPFLKR